jgi:hypothetical protein
MSLFGKKLKIEGFEILNVIAFEPPLKVRPASPSSTFRQAAI